MKRKKWKVIAAYLLIVALLIPAMLQPAQASTGRASGEVTEVKAKETDNTQMNYFSYHAYSGKSWTTSDSEAYIDLGTSDAKAEECYYEFTFYGNAVELFANKSHLHGKVKYSVDGQNEKTVDLYQSSRSDAVSVYQLSGLSEGKHILKAVTLNEKSGSKVVNQVAYAKVTHEPYTGTPNLGGTICSTNLQYTQDKYSEISGKNVTSETLSVWKNDKVFSEVVLFSKNCSLKNVKVETADLENGTEVIKADHVTATFVKSTKAYNGSYLGYGSKDREVPKDTGSNRSESSDILYTTEPVTIAWNQLQPVWLEFAIPKTAKAGNYHTTLKVTADGIEQPLTFDYTIKVQDAELPDSDTFADSFDIELWQYPYSSAEYYDVEAFSEEHLEILRPIMEKYKEVGGHAITTSIVEEAWNGQTYSKNEVHYPSMVKWIKNADGSFSYDYTDFDKWVTFNKELGIGDKIVLYSIAPWHNSFTYWDNGTLKYEAFTAGSDRYKTVWTSFLTDLIAHLETKGWFEESYIGIDERGFKKEAFDLIDSVKNLHGQSLKTAGAMDSFVEKKDLAMRVDDLNVGDSAAAAHLSEFKELLRQREVAGLRTTLYSCTGHTPGNFSLSSPAESYWSLIHAGKQGTAGFLRWSYDAWVENPLEDATHNAFEPGDCFLVYPSEKTAAKREVKSSVRLEKMAEGVRDVNKLRLMEAEVPALADEIKDLYEKVTTEAKGQTRYLSADEKANLSEEMIQFKEGLEALTEKYIQIRAGSTSKVEKITFAEGSKCEISLGESKKLNLIFSPENVLNTAADFSSSDPAIVSVSDKGVITAERIGTAVITAVSKADSTKTAEITVQVNFVDVDDADKISYYSFEQIEGTKIKDEWGNRDAVLSGGLLSSGKTGNALEVTKDSKGAVIENLPVTKEAWTVVYWVYSTASGDRSSILMNQSETCSFDASISSANQKSGVHVGTGTGDVLTFQYTLPKENWVHMAWTQDKTNGLSLYVNGTLVQTNVWTKTNAFSCPADIIGGTGFAGKIDDLKVYGRVLTVNEIKGSMMSKGLNLQETKKELKIGESWQIISNLISDQEDKTITYSSKQPQIASVSKDGTVKAKKRGTAYVVVKNEASGYEETVEIKVIKELKAYNTVPVYQLEESKLSVIDKDQGGARQYLGQPDMVLLDDDKTLITVYPVGHGHGPLVMKVSKDAGETWTEKTDIPSSWSKSLETPTLYKLKLANGKTRVMLITALPNWGNGETDAAGHSGGWNTSYSDDGGETWTEYKNWHEKKKDGTTNYTIVAMASLIQLKDKDGNDIQKWMGVYHDANFVNYKTYLTFDENGEEHWTEPEPYLSEYRSIESKYQMCEIGMFRSPDGKRIVGLARSQSHNNPSSMIYSDDEGESWSEPIDLPGSLSGERHKAIYDPLTGRLLITFREIQFDLNKNNQFDGANDWMAGDWVAWVGTYEDLMEQNEGQYQILLAEDWANNRYSGDTGYAGVTVQKDGTFVLDSYGHWDKEFSQSWQGTNGGGYNVKTDLCYIKQAKFKLSDLDKEAVKETRKKLVEEFAEAPTDAEKYTTASWEAYQSVWKQAEKVLADTDSEQAETYEILMKLRQAVLGLEEGTTDLQPNPKPDLQPDKKPDQTPTPDKRPISGNTENKLQVGQTATGEGKYDVYLYRVTGSDTVEIKQLTEKGKNQKKLTIFDQVVLRGSSYRVTTVAAKAFRGNKKLTTLTVGKNVTKIGNQAFENCTNLKKVTIQGNALTTVGKKAFAKDKKLKKLTMKKLTVLKKVGKGAFNGISKKTAVKVSKKKVKVYKKLFIKNGMPKTAKIK